MMIPVTDKFPEFKASDEELEYQAKVWARMTTHATRQKSPKEWLKEDCLIWTGSKKWYGRTNYGQRKSISCHVVSWIIREGVTAAPKKDENDERLVIRHMCDVPLCFEPSHLQLGTQKENVADAIAAGRIKHGEKHHSATITEDLARQIKQSKRNRDDPEYKTMRERAKRFNVNITLVQGIDEGGSWSHLPDYYGNTHEDVKKKIRKITRESRKRATNRTWTEEDWDKARKKLQDPNYVRRHPTKKWNGNGVHCLEWIRYESQGYGRTTVKGRNWYVHNLACTIANNCIRPDGLEAAHRCGFTLCVEPTHLYFGTREENANDCFEHGTTRRVLSDDQVCKIRKRYVEENVSHQILASEYDVSKSTIQGLTSGKTYKHLLQ